MDVGAALDNNAVDAAQRLLAEALRAEAIDRADLQRIVAASPDYASAVERVRVVFPEWRLGQTFMNVLRVARPELYREVKGSDVDCFYVDSRVPALVQWLRRQRATTTII